MSRDGEGTWVVRDPGNDETRWFGPDCSDEGRHESVRLRKIPNSPRNQTGDPDGEP